CRDPRPPGSAAGPRARRHPLAAAQPGHAAGTDEAAKVAGWRGRSGRLDRRVRPVAAAGRAAAGTGADRPVLAALVAGRPAGWGNEGAARTGGDGRGDAAGDPAGRHSRCRPPPVGRGQAARGPGPAVPRQRGSDGGPRPGRTAARRHGSPMPARRRGAGPGGRAHGVLAHRARLAVRRLRRQPAGPGRVRRAARRGDPLLGVARMNARQRGILVGAILLGLPLVLLVGAIWFQRHFEKVEQRLPLPPGGEAASDPLYTLRRVLEADGMQVHAHDGLAAAAVVGSPRDTVLLHGDPAMVDTRQAAMLLSWVERGGHLVLRTPPRGGDPGEVPLLAALGLHDALRAPRCEQLRVPGQPDHVEFCRGRRFTPGAAYPPRLHWG